MSSRREWSEREMRAGSGNDSMKYFALNFYDPPGRLIPNAVNLIGSCGLLAHHSIRAVGTLNRGRHLWQHSHSSSIRVGKGHHQNESPHLEASASILCVASMIGAALPESHASSLDSKNRDDVAPGILSSHFAAASRVGAGGALRMTLTTSSETASSGPGRHVCKQSIPRCTLAPRP